MFNATRKEFWQFHREAALNWLALGLLLAAWNASDGKPPPDLRRSPRSECRDRVGIPGRATESDGIELGRTTPSWFWSRPRDPGSEADNATDHIAARQRRCADRHSLPTIALSWITYPTSAM